MWGQIETILLDIDGTMRSTGGKSEDEKKGLIHHEAAGTPIISPETGEVLVNLFRRGYRLGLVGNTRSGAGVPAALQELNMAGCVETIVLSAPVGSRKPDPGILLEAARRMNVAPEKCAYIGHRGDRDVAAARQAGFSKVVILSKPRQVKSDRERGGHLAPDAVIPYLTGLLEIFPPRSAPEPAAIYDASLSTLWAIKNFPNLADFLEAARRLGFSRIELSHQVTTPMLSGIDLGSCQISSLHEPCPADIGEEELKVRDWLISSTDEASRLMGVKVIQRSIDMARQVGASAIVLHAGHPTLDKDRLEKELRAMTDAGERGSDEYRAVYSHMLKLRAEHAPAGFESVRKSLLELLAYAAPSGIRLGLENRYHYLEYPSPDELSILLGLAGPEQVAFVYDIGHAQALSRLGFFPKEVWLERFASRIVGVHLHDVIGTADHFAPGLGEVDFTSVAASLPENSFRTCEFQAFNTFEHVKAGLRFLADHGCIRTL